MSALEYQKNTGLIDLSHLKRKKTDETVINLDASLTDAQLKILAKMAAPKNLAPVDLGGKKHQASMNTIMTYGAKTTDIT
jgi:hypothetical protein